MKEIIPQETIKALSPEGKQRLLVLIGEDHNKNHHVIKYLGDSITEVYPNSFSILVDAEKIETPQDWCSQFARNLRTNSDLKESDVFNFALNIGRTLGSVKTLDKQTNNDTDEGNKNIAESLVEHFDQLLEKRGERKNTPHIILGLSGLDKTTEPLRQWLVNHLNQALRKSANFKKSRFLFSIKKQDDLIDAFLNEFGFEKVHYKNIYSEPKNILPNSDSSQLLNKDMSISPETDLLDNFSDAELEYLKLCAYPNRISKYSLGHFVSNRNAALAYNWLSRQKSICSVHESGDLVLNDPLKQSLRSLHAEQNVEQAEQWNIHASVVDAFYSLFPNDSTHWIPLNLQLLHSFDHTIIKNLFSDDQATEVIDFIDSHPHSLTETNDKLSLTDEAKVVTRRFMEVSGLTIIPGLEVSIRELWLKDLKNYNYRKSKLDEERGNISTEIEETLKQVSSIKNAKDELVENFRNPKKNKPQKVYSFTTSRLLIVIGFATVGASLLSENIGSYHAACGLALSLFGFFWPNVETKRPAFATGGPTSNLAIETQQRSLNHRISSLSNRVQVMKGNLNAVEKQLEKLGVTPPLAYLDSEQSEV